MVDPHFAANQTALAILMQRIDALRTENEGLKRVIEDDAKLILRVRMENEKLRAATTELLSHYYDAMRRDGYADEEVRSEHVFRAAAAALKETGDE